MPMVGMSLAKPVVLETIATQTAIVYDLTKCLAALS